MQSEKHKRSIKKYDCKNCYLFILRLYILANGNLSKFITFPSLKLYNLISSVSRIAQIHLIQVCKFCFFGVGLHIFYKYAWYNPLCCSMMWEIPLVLHKLHTEQTQENIFM